MLNLSVCKQSPDRAVREYGGSYRTVLLLEKAVLAVPLC